MRLCFVSHSTSHFTKPYVDYFTSLGYEVHLVSLFREDVSNAINHHPLATFSRTLLPTLTYLRALEPVRRAVRSISPTIVHAHYLTSNGVLAAFAGCRPLVVSIHGSDLHGMRHPIRRAAARFALNHADLVNPVSQHMQSSLLSLGVDPRKLLPLSQGVETNLLRIDRSGRHDGPPRLLCTRRLEARYNCITIIRALSLLRARGIAYRATFAADGPDEASLRKEVSRRGLDDLVTFLGGYRQEALAGLLAAADIYVSAKPEDGASVSLLEAMASGLFPVVADIPGNREWLTGEGDGLLFHPYDSSALASCLEAAISNDALRRQAAQINLVRVRGQGDRATNLARLADAYRKLTRVA
jgi:glycosyltransferase involved in cell wall biosynthesis